MRIEQAGAKHVGSGLAAVSTRNRVRGFSSLAISAMVVLAGSCASIVHAMQDAASALKPEVESALLEPLTEPAPALSPVSTPEPALAPDANEARQIFERARDHIRTLNYLRFDSKSYATEGMAKLVTAANGTVIAVRAPSGSTNHWMLRATGTTVPRGAEAGVVFDYAILPGSREWVNHDLRKVIEVLKTAAGGTSMTAPNGLLPTDVLDKLPFTRAMKNASYTLESAETVDGVECDVVLLDASGGKSRWYIGQDDHFPRKIVRLVSYMGEACTIVNEFTSVQTGSARPADVDDASMRVTVPPGYAEQREKPKPPPPPPVVMPEANDGQKQDQSTQDGDKGLEGKQLQGDNAPSMVVPVAPPAPALPAIAPAFELSKIDGTKVTLESMRGSVVVLDFFGTWALSSEAWHGQLKTILESSGSGAVAGENQPKLVSIVIRQRSPELAQAKLIEAGIFTPLLIGSDEVASQYGIHVYPAAAVVGKDGTLIAVIQGCGSEDSVEKLIAAIARASVESNPSK